MNQESKNIDEILARFFDGKTTKEEDQVINKWLAKSKTNQQTFQKLQSYLHQPQLNITDNRLKIWNNLKKEKKSRKFRKYYFLSGKVAVVMLIVASIIFLNDQITISNNDEKVTVEMVQKRAEAGQKLLVTLPDGSSVKLNSQSSIEYPSIFNDSLRKVNLIGEAFFEVKKDSLRPFVIKSKDITTQVIGTSFNIAAYPEKKDVQVALLTGKVKVYNQSNQSYFLDPGQVITISDTDFQVELFNYQKVFGWKEGIIIFEGASFIEVVQRLERWYGVIFTYEQPVPEWNYNGVFSNATLKEVLQVLADSEGFNYEINDKNVNINL